MSLWSSSFNLSRNSFFPPSLSRSTRVSRGVLARISENGESDNQYLILETAGVDKVVNVTMNLYLRVCLRVNHCI